MENIKYCEYCGKEINLEQKYGSGRFCNKRCQILSVHKKGAEIAGEKSKQETEKRKKIVKCLYCGKEWKTTEKNRKFCSSSCAAKYNNSKRVISDSTRIKTSESLKKFHSQQPKKIFYCSECGKEIGKTKTGFCKNCLNSSEAGKKILSENSKKAMDILVKSGNHKGWKTRNTTSYAEQFWIEVLDNNKVSYKREFRVKYGEKSGEHYFLDFLIEKNNVLIDLEIDGKQHQYEERKNHDKIRDERLSKIGYRIYRINWNEINSEQGKTQMKSKIDNFISYLNSL